MPEHSRQTNHLLYIQQLAARVLFAWNFYDDPGKMVVLISEAAIYPDLGRAIEALRAALDETIYEFPEAFTSYPIISSGE